MSKSSPVRTHYALRCAVFAALVIGLAAAAFPGAATAQGLVGKFTAVKPAPAPHSQDVVVVEEFLNFTCPHCNSFRDAAKPVFSKYGKRLKLVRVPIQFKGQIDTPLRLFYIAQSKGKEDLIDAVLFDTVFKYGVNVFDPQVVGYIARTNDLQDQYEKEAGADWVTRRVADGHARADTFGIEATPSLVLQGALRLVPEGSMEDFIKNFDTLVGQLLK
jgi:protein-disulfide isomerase